MKQRWIGNDSAMTRDLDATFGGTWMRLLEGLGCDIWGDLDATFGGVDQAR